MVSLIAGTNASTPQAFNLKSQKLYTHWKGFFDASDSASAGFYTFSGTLIDKPFSEDADGLTGTLTNGTKSRPGHNNHMSSLT